MSTVKKAPVSTAVAEYKSFSGIVSMNDNEENSLNPAGHNGPPEIKTTFKRLFTASNIKDLLIIVLLVVFVAGQYATLNEVRVSQSSLNALPSALADLPPKTIPFGAVRIMHELKVFSHEISGSYAPIANVVKVPIVYNDSISNQAVPIHFGTIVYTLVGLLNPSPYPSGGNVSTPPTVIQPVDGDYFTIILMDPDSRDSATHQQLIMHWWVANIKGNGIGQPLDFSASTPVFGYLKPGPSINSGLHRYTFLLFRQKGYTTPSRFPPFVAGTDQYGHSATTTVSNSRYYNYPRQLLVAYYDAVPKIVGINYMQVYNVDNKQKNYPYTPVMGFLVYTVGGPITDIKITNIGSGYIIGPPVITINGCTGASAAFFTNAISSTGSLRLVQPQANAPGLQTVGVSVLALLDSSTVFNVTCAAGATVLFSNPPTVVANI